MIRDLSQVEAPGLEVRTPLCIIGAGTAGIFLACQLRALGVDVLLLETGDRFARSANEMAQTCAQRGIRYRGAEQGRSFGLGGTSVLWGGQMIPLTAADMQARPAVGIDAWPIDHAELTNHLAHVKQSWARRGRAGESPCRRGSGVCSMRTLRAPIGPIRDRTRVAPAAAGAGCECGVGCRQPGYAAPTRQTRLHRPPHADPALLDMCEMVRQFGMIDWPSIDPNSRSRLHVRSRERDHLPAPEYRGTAQTEAAALLGAR